MSIGRHPFVDGMPASLPARRPQQGGHEMTQYLLSVWHDDANYDMDFSSEEAQRLVRQVDALNNEIQEAGAWVFGGGLVAPTSATVVRAQDGQVSMTDGPYAESKEQ